ncbi:MAG: bifunctional ADP-dependent (S)-NAD(P)H-hydrate dehydratase/NAD(P)H-hydrate epimerase [Rhodocyclales bacterium GWA2_65_20]|nr:MAG: bifunctional ADP-dependent (S)-NAD(P)H-hydrate dehydratase/NAD(P)H-hydrate epimerase [Rhodocyclales bacterium GWA2_65_20]
MPAVILRTSLLRAVEARFLADADPPLMERAGAAAAAVAAAMLAAGGAVLVVAGPGNNGGDAFVVARLLKEAGHEPVVVFAGTAEKLPADAGAALAAWQRAGGEILPEIPTHPFALAVDGLFGIGITRPLAGRYAELVGRINSLGCPVLALDVPSGLDAETGRVMGVAVKATRTATFIALKPGLLTLDGPDHCGEIGVHPLGLAFAETDGFLNGVDLFRACLTPRLRNSHKGSYGSAGIIGGAPGMAGAALLAGRAALKLGAGRVYVGMLEAMTVDPMQAELMLRAPDEVFALATALAIGPGLGQTAAAAELLRQAIAAPLPLVVDADALNLLAIHPVLQGLLARRNAPTLLTPHPAEAARLLGTTTATVQSDRVAAALQLAARCHADVVLKGCGSVVAAAAGAWAVNATGNAGLAAAGSGDVLTGIVVALLAQGWPAREALLGAVHLHGAAADALVAAGTGPIGMSAGELLAPARMLLNNWVAAA